MSNQTRDDSGQFTPKMSNQDILKVFDFDATDTDPYLSTAEVTAGLAEHFDIEVTDEAVRQRLQTMAEHGHLQRRAFGSSVAWRALVGPKPAEDVAATSEERQATAREDFVALDDG